MLAFCLVGGKKGAIIRPLKIISLHLQFVLYIGTDSTPRSTTPTFPTDATASPQKGPNYIVIGVSVFGGLLLLMIGALLIKKFVFNASRSPVVGIPERDAKVNECYQGDLELSDMSGKM